MNGINLTEMMKQQNLSLSERLTEYNKTAIPMHMPGHKRNTELLTDVLPYEIDITEIHGFDNLHSMNGILKETASLAASLYGSREAFPLVGGSTCGILAAVHAAVPFGSHVLVARNCHKSVFHAVELRGLYPHYIRPDTDAYGICGELRPEAVERVLRNESKISLVVVTSPTYEGVVSNLAEIAAVCHKHNALLLVDSAHGAHFGFSPHFPASAVTSGADLVVMSLHKTMPALTQTALLHICTDTVDKSKVAEALALFETSSPSYVLLASIDRCLRLIAESGERLFTEFYENMSFFNKEMKDLRALSAVRYDDIGKQMISAKNTLLTGPELADILRKQFNIEVEMAGTDYILAITGICDKKEHLLQFAEALKHIDADTPRVTQNRTAAKNMFSMPKMAETPFDAQKQQGKFVPIQGAVGHECLESIWAYPPGIPLIVPGETIDRNLINTINDFARANITLNSTKGFQHNKIWVKQ